ncbi:MAG TPA: YceI family protein [Bryobacteraceae bacterium]|jgi:polyisoprenoid-binding protein YceI|nr:YceI family protein [Bryobacteraceae bacterium]
MKARYTIDQAHTSAQFSIRHMMITNVRGGFSSVKGTAEYDADNLSNSSVDIVIDTNTITTHDEQRDAHLKSADFLDVEKYPTITFKSTKVTAEGEGESKVEGNLTIHGVTKPVVLNVEGPSAESKDPWGNIRIGASATTKIKRSEFGLTWNAALETGGIMVGDDLKIELDVQMIKSAASAA